MIFFVLVGVAVLSVILGCILGHKNKKHILDITVITVFIVFACVMSFLPISNIMPNEKSIEKSSVISSSEITSLNEEEAISVIVYKDESGGDHAIYRMMEVDDVTSNAQKSNYVSEAPKRSVVRVIIDDSFEKPTLRVANPGLTFLTHPNLSTVKVFFFILPSSDMVRDYR